VGDTVDFFLYVTLNNNIISWRGYLSFVRDYINIIIQLEILISDICVASILPRKK
jgi:hypothetical protein